MPSTPRSWATLLSHFRTAPFAAPSSALLRSSTVSGTGSKPWSSDPAAMRALLQTTRKVSDLHGGQRRGSHLSMVSVLCVQCVYRPACLPSFLWSTFSSSQFLLPAVAVKRFERRQNACGRDARHCCQSPAPLGKGGRDAAAPAAAFATVPFVLPEKRPRTGAVTSQGTPQLRWDPATCCDKEQTINVLQSDDLSSRQTMEKNETGCAGE